MNLIDIEAASIIHTSQDDAFTTLLSLVFSSIGIVLSAGALALLFLTALLFAEWRRNYKNQLIIQFMTVRFLYTFVRYMNDIRSLFKMFIGNTTIMYFDLFASVYTETALVFWMFVFTKQMHDSLVNVYVPENYKLWKVSALAWLTPVFTSMLLGFMVTLHRENLFNIYFFFLVIVKWPVLVANAAFLILALKYILKNNRSNPENNARIILVMIILIFMFCFQQLLVDSYKMIYVLVLHRYSISSYLLMISHIFSLFHCAFSIMFWVFGNANTRRMWRRPCSGFRSQQRPESLSYSK